MPHWPHTGSPPGTWGDETRPRTLACPPPIPCQSHVDSPLLAADAEALMPAGQGEQQACTAARGQCPREGTAHAPAVERAHTRHPRRTRGELHGLFSVHSPLLKTKGSALAAPAASACDTGGWAQGNRANSVQGSGATTLGDPACVPLGPPGDGHDRAKGPWCLTLVGRPMAAGRSAESRDDAIPTMFLSWRRQNPNLSLEWDFAGVPRTVCRGVWQDVSGAGTCSSCRVSLTLRVRARRGRQSCPEVLPPAEQAAPKRSSWLPSQPAPHNPWAEGGKPNTTRRHTDSGAGGTLTYRGRHHCIVRARVSSLPVLCLRPYP